MKKIIALLTAVIMLISAAPAFAADGEAEKVLIEVKSKVDIPEDMENFQYSSNAWNGEEVYYFCWDKDSGNIDVSADKDGNIKSYYYYDESFYNDEKKAIIRTSEAEAKEVAEAFVKKAFPEMFEKSDDVLLIEDSETNVSSSGTAKRFNFVFKRYYKGIQVYNNSVNVTVYANNTVTAVTDMNASIDTNAVFDESEHGALAEKDYEKEFPAKLYYKIYYSGGEQSVKLVYTMDKGFVSEKDGKKVEAVGSSDAILYAGNADAVEESGAGSAKRVNLTPKELEELSNMGELFTKEELEAKLRQTEELKITDGMELSYSNTYKDGEEYYVTLSLSDEGEDGDRSIYAYFNASTGEILSIYNYSYTSERGKLTDTEKAESREKAKAFMTKIETDKMKDVKLTEDGSQIIATRLVNGVEYPANYIKCDYYGDMVTSYSVNWDKDVSAFENPAKAIGEDAAYEAMFKATELQHVWVNTKDGYIPAITIGKNVTLDALTGEDLYKASKKAEYSDISGHWAEEMIKTLIEQNIYLDGDTFRPDENITQGDMLRLFGALFYYPSFARSDIDYDWLIKYKGVITKDEADENKAVTREEAFNTFVKMMGAGEIASLDIFKATFDDAGDFKNGCGSAEILKAMGVISGNTARPGDLMTRAEAVSIIYHYLDR